MAGIKDTMEAENRFEDDIFGNTRTARSETQKLIDGLLGVPLSVELKALKEQEGWHSTSAEQKSSPSHIESILERSQRALRADSLSSIKRPSPVDGRVGRKLESLWDRRKEKSKDDSDEEKETGGRKSGSLRKESKEDDTDDEKKATVSGRRLESLWDRRTEKAKEDNEDEERRASVSGARKVSDRREEKKTTTVIDLRPVNDSAIPQDSDDKDSSSSKPESSSPPDQQDSDVKDSSSSSEQKNETKTEDSDEKKGQTTRSDSPAERRTEKKGDSQREKALREWNVMPDQPHRPPLSRQSSQQQLIRKPEAEGTSEREKAFRDWNVTGIVQELDEALQGFQVC